MSLLKWILVISDQAPRALDQRHQEEKRKMESIFDPQTLSLSFDVERGKLSSIWSDLEFSICVSVKTS